MFFEVSRVHVSPSKLAQWKIELLVLKHVSENLISGSKSVENL